MGGEVINITRNDLAVLKTIICKLKVDTTKYFALAKKRCELENYMYEVERLNTEIALMGEMSKIYNELIDCKYTIHNYENAFELIGKDYLPAEQNIQRMSLPTSDAIFQKIKHKR